MSVLEKEDTEDMAKQQEPTDPELQNSDFSNNHESAPLMEAAAKSLDRLRSHCPWVPAAASDCCTLKAVKKWLITNLLLLLTVIAVLFGAVLGIAMREVNMPRHSNGYLLMVELLSFPGEVFLRMLKMLILPLIVFSLIAGLGSLETKVAGSLGWKTVAYYGCTTVLAVVLGLILVNVIRPGHRHREFECDNATLHDVGGDVEVVDTILDLIRNMIPDNLFAATFQQSETQYTVKNVTDFNECLQQYGLNRSDIINDVSTGELSNLSNGSSSGGYVSCSRIQQYFREMNLSCKNATTFDRRFISVVPRDGMNVLGIIVFTIAFGVTLGRLGEGGRSIVQAVGVLNTAIMKLVSLVMWYSPIGIASIIAGKLAEVDDFLALFQEIGLYFATVLVGLCIHGCIVLPLIYLITTRRNPLRVVRAVPQALLTAFATSSSSATLPITIQNLEDHFGADPRVTRFMLPVGATINMDGTALYEAVAAVFIAQVQGINLSIPKMIVVSITATCASVGAAGIPQAGLFTLVIVLVAVGLNPENVALILAVDWLLDRFRTTVNVLGDTFGVGIVEYYSRKQLGLLPKPLLQRDTTDTTNSTDSSTVANNDSFHRDALKSQDYGTSSPPPPTLHQIPSPDWSISSLDSSQQPKAGHSDSGGGGGGQPSRHDSLGSPEILREETNL